MASVRRSPPPPIQMGTRSCTGRGAQRASSRVNHLPLKLVLSLWSRPRTHWTASSRMSSLVPTEGKGMP